MSKVLIIDKDVHTINSLSSLLAVYGIETIVVHNWPSQIKNLDPGTLGAIFVDVELRSVHINKLHESFSADPGNKIPIFYLYSRTFAPRFVEAKNFPYSGSFKKPIELNEIYEHCREHLEFDNAHIISSGVESKYQEFKDFREGFVSWLNTLELVLNKSVPDNE